MQTQFHDDPLEDLFGAPLRITPIVPPASYKPLFVERCQNCGGSGRYRGWSGTLNSDCFACKGSGKQAFKTSPEARAAGRARGVEQARSKEAELRATREAFEAANTDVMTWLRATVARLAKIDNNQFDFPQKLLAAFGNYGSLSDGQIAAVRKMMDNEAARKAERAAKEALAPEISITRIEESFATASANGLKYPKLRLGSFEFSPAGANSANRGAIYVKDGAEYLGKITAGRFVCVRSCGEERQARVIEVAADPEAAATAYGKMTGSCSCCGRFLENAESVARGIGPICAMKYGW